MGLAPELRILILNAVVLGVAYFGLYPGFREKTLGRLMAADLVVTASVLLAAGALFAGTGTRFSLLFVPTNWLIFTLLTLLAMEMPLFLRFYRRWGIDPWGPDGRGARLFEEPSKRLRRRLPRGGSARVASLPAACSSPKEPEASGRAPSRIDPLR